MSSWKERAEPAVSTVKVFRVTGEDRSKVCASGRWATDRRRASDAAVALPLPVPRSMTVSDMQAYLGQTRLDLGY